uniref:Uncharacterized protein n=1 Tax=Physcomitrium patens TaxID=3218 RepID=A0A7I3Z4F6_PHYPA
MFCLPLMSLGCVDALMELSPSCYNLVQSAEMRVGQRCVAYHVVDYTLKAGVMSGLDRDIYIDWCSYRGWQSKHCQKEIDHANYFPRTSNSCFL